MKKVWKWMIPAMFALTAVAAQAAPRAALFVQNRAGAVLEDKIDAFAELVSARLSDAGFEVVRSQDVLARFSESHAADEAQTFRREVETLQTAKSEGTAEDDPTRAATAVRAAQLMDADCLIFATMISLGNTVVRTRAYGTENESTVTTLRVALRVLDGTTGAQLYGDTVTATDKILQTAFAQTASDDQVNLLLDRGAADLAARVGTAAQSVAARLSAPEETVTMTVASSVAGAAVEFDGIATGTTPGTFQLRPGIHRLRVSKEGYATWEKSVNVFDGQTLNVALEYSGSGLERRGEQMAQDLADDVIREQSAADAELTRGRAVSASNSYIRMEGMPETLSVGSRDGIIHVLDQNNP